MADWIRFGTSNTDLNPASVLAGVYNAKQCYFNKVSNKGFEWNGSKWVNSLVTENDLLSLSKLYAFGVFDASGTIIQPRFIVTIDSSDQCGYSDDGINWEFSTLPFTYMYGGSCFGNGKFIVLGPNQKLAISDDGIAWEEEHFPFSWANYNVQFGGNKFVAIANDAGKAAYSYDGALWYEVNLPFSATWRALSYGNGVWVMGSQNDGRILYSTNGMSWNAADPPAGSFGWISACHDGEKFILMPIDSDVVAYSYDGENWSYSTLPSSGVWHGVCYHDGVYVAVTFGMSNNSDAAAYSYDGINWTATTLPSLGSRLSVAYGVGKFWAFSVDNLASSVDGVIWQEESLDAPGPYRWLVAGQVIKPGFGEVIEDGTEDYPFLIYTEADLRQVGTGIDGWAMNKCYKLMADIELPDPVAPDTRNWSPIGDPLTNSNYSVDHFLGIFDGNGHSVSNITYTGYDSNLSYYYGLFAYVGPAGIVRNLRVTDVEITGWNSGSVGGIVGDTYGLIDNCFSSGSFHSWNFSGGIVGNNYGTISHCSAVVSFMEGDYCGGIAGGSYGIISDCLFQGVIDDAWDYAGGIVGRSDELVENCISIGQINSSFRAGGIVGSMGEKNVKNCVALTSSVIGSYYALQSNSYFSRIASSYENTVGINNYARSDMIVQSDDSPPFVKELIKGTDQEDGADITAAQWEDINWWRDTALFTDPWWNEKLPFSYGHFHYTPTIPPGWWSPSEKTGPVSGSKAIIRGEGCIIYDSSTNSIDLHEDFWDCIDLGGKFLFLKDVNDESTHFILSNSGLTTFTDVGSVPFRVCRKYSHQSFPIVNGKLIFGRSGLDPGPSIAVFDIATEVVSEVGNLPPASWSSGSSEVVGDKVLFYSGIADSPVAAYDSVSNTVSEVFGFPAVDYLYSFAAVGDKVFLSRSSSFTSVYIYDSVSGVVQEFTGFPSSFLWTLSGVIGSKAIFYIYGVKNLFIYDSQANSFSEFECPSNPDFYSVKISYGGKFFFTGGSYYKPFLGIYDSSSDSLSIRTDIYPGAGGSLTLIGTKILICGEGRNLSILDPSDNSITQVNGKLSLSCWGSAGNLVVGTKVIVSPDWGHGTSVVIYDSETNSAHEVLGLFPIVWMPYIAIGSKVLLGPNYNRPPTLAVLDLESKSLFLLGEPWPENEGPPDEYEVLPIGDKVVLFSSYEISRLAVYCTGSDCFGGELNG